MINLGTIVKSRLADGKHTVTLAGHRVVNNEKGGYIELQLNFPDRVAKWNVFPTQFDYVFGSLQKGLDLTDQDVSYGDILKLAETNKFDIWKSVNDYGINWSLSAPREEVGEEINLEDIASAL